MTSGIARFDVGVAFNGVKVGARFALGHSGNEFGIAKNDPVHQWHDNAFNGTHVGILLAPHFSRFDQDLGQCFQISKGPFYGKQDERCQDIEERVRGRGRVAEFQFVRIAHLTQRDQGGRHGGANIGSNNLRVCVMCMYTYDADANQGSIASKMKCECRSHAVGTAIVGGVGLDSRTTKIPSRREMVPDSSNETTKATTELLLCSKTVVRIPIMTLLKGLV
jgi:hypothetical protein